MTQRQHLNSLHPLPDSVELLFVSNMHGEEGQLGFIAGEIYAMDTEGENIVRVTHDGWTHNHLSISPDRRYIISNRYVEDSNGDGQLDFRDRKQLWVVDLHKGEQWPLEPDRDAGWGGVDWGPDDYIYASMMDPGPVDRDVIYKNRTDIFRVRPDGSDLQRLTDGVEKELWEGAHGKFVSDVGVSPDGRWMAFSFKPVVGGKPYLKSHIAVARTDGSEARLVSDGGPLEPEMRGPWSAGDFDAEFSPDGTAVVFERATNAGTNVVEDTLPGTPREPKSSYDIVRVNVDGTDERRLTPENDPALKGIPDWSADDRIVYRELDGRDGFQGPVFMNADGTDRRRLPGVKGMKFRWLPPL